MKSALALGIVSTLLVFGVGSAVPEFSIADLSKDGQLLFSCRSEQPGWGPYSTALRTELGPGGGIEILTFFPERTRYFRSTGEFQIQNRFGLYRGTVNGRPDIRELTFHPSFAQGAEIPVGRILPEATSPDGRWVVLQVPDTAVRGRLMLHDTRTGAAVTVSRNHVLDYRRPPALWSPDSRYMLYARSGRLYYVSLRHVEEGRLPDESYREFGEGELSSVRWSGADSLFYLSGSLVSLLRPSEFFTGSFYADPLPSGRPSGVLPVRFDPNFDAFWPSPDGSSILVLKEDRNLFRFPLDGDDGRAASLPFLVLPRDSTVLQLWWRSDGTILLLTGGSRRQETPYRLFEMGSDSGEPAGFRPREVPGIRSFAPSADRRRLAVLTDAGVSIRDVESLEEARFLDHPDPRDVYWIGPDRLLVFGSHRCETIDISEDRRRLLLISQAEILGYDAEGTTALVSSGRHYRFEPVQGAWAEADEGSGGGIRPPTRESAAYRVYEQNLASAVYRNAIMVRTIDGYGTRALFEAPERPVEGMPESDADEPVVDDGVFTHGPRDGDRAVALVFNAVDGDEGLGEILNVLADHGLTATFFVGGDFIRRQPGSAAKLAESGHEIGSLFYTHMDLADYRYRIDTEFVVRGMARTEDEFFRATGREVSTIWHAPWYVVNPAIMDATERMGYIYVGRDVDPLDWVTLDGTPASRELYRRAPRLVERTLQAVRPGSIVPVRIGIPGNRDDYFFRKLDLLINGLLKDGYDIVSVGDLRESHVDTIVKSRSMPTDHKIGMEGRAQ